MKRDLLIILALSMLTGIGCKKAPKQVEPVQVVEVEQEQKPNPNISLVNKADLVLDVRRADEFDQGHLNGAVNIPHNQIESRVEEISEYRNKSVVLYCRSGRRASLARTQLLANGFTNVVNVGAYYDLLVAEPEPIEEESPY